MPSKNERVELEMKIIKARQWTRRVTDENFLKRLRDQIVVLEKSFARLTSRLWTNPTRFSL
jgi:hypothetical protein